MLDALGYKQTATAVVVMASEGESSSLTNTKEPDSPPVSTVVQQLVSVQCSPAPPIQDAGVLWPRDVYYPII